VVLELRTIINLWEQALKRKDLVGGELEHQEMPEGVFRGPIKSIKLVRDKGKVVVVVETEWTAHAPMRGPLPSGGWKRYTGKNSTTFAYELTELEGFGIQTSAPRDIGSGRLHFGSLFGIANVTIFPKGGSKLDKKKVAGF